MTAGNVFKQPGVFEGMMQDLGHEVEWRPTGHGEVSPVVRVDRRQMFTFGAELAAVHARRLAPSAQYVLDVLELLRHANVTEHGPNDFELQWFALAKVEEP